jgi:hypothetical protein
MIALKDQDDVRLTFSASTVGGMNAIRALLRDFRLVRHKHPGMVPVVKIGVGDYVHRIHRNKVEYPVFEITDWADWGDEPVAAPKPAPKALPKSEAAKKAKEVPGRDQRRSARLGGWRYHLKSIRPRQRLRISGGAS